MIVQCDSPECIIQLEEKVCYRTNRKSKTTTEIQWPKAPASGVNRDKTINGGKSGQARKMYMAANYGKFFLYGKSAKHT